MNAKLSFAAMLMLVSLNAASDAPPERIAPHATGVAAYAQAALDAYAEGYVFIERAARLEEDARDNHSSRAELKEELSNEARLAYEDALIRFEEAVGADQRMYEAHTYLGYVNRKLGKHIEALSAYDTALKLKPDYVRAIEYQAEAYLGLDRFEDAKRNYFRLYALDEAQADLLLGAMHRWLDHKPERDRASASAKDAAAWLKDRPMPADSADRAGLAHW